MPNSAAKILFVGALSLLTAACSSFNDMSLIRPYRIDVRQGNFVTQEMAAQLKPGMTRKQVRFVLGSPLIEDPFHADRWDYAYRLSKGRGNADERRLTVFFDKDLLARVEGDIVAKTGGDAPVEAPSHQRVIEIGDPKAANPVPPVPAANKP